MTAFYPPIRSRSAGGRPAILYRRLQPETILVGATGGATQFFNGAAAVWTFGAWTQTVSAATFGAAARRLAQIVMVSGVNAVLVGAGAVGFRRKWVYELGTGGAGAEVAMHRVQHAVTMAGTVATADAATVTDVTASDTVSLLAYFPQVPASSRVTVRAAKNDAGAAALQRMTTVWYADPLPTFRTLDDRRLGTREVWPNLADHIVACGLYPAFGAYIDVFPAPNFTAPARMLVESIAGQHDGAIARDVSYEMAIGAPASEVLHARAHIPAPRAGFLGNGKYTFWPPFEVQAGERLRVRAATQLAGVNVDTTVQTARVV